MSKSILPIKRKADNGDRPIDDNEHVDDKDKDVVMLELENEEEEDIHGDVEDKDTLMVNKDEEKTNLIYLSVREHYYDPSVDWYVLDTDAGTLVKDLNMSTYSLPINFSCTVLSSKVYVIGGELKPSKFLFSDDADPALMSKAVYVYHTSKKEWQVGPAMHVSRLLPLAVSLGKRIYVFGGTKVPPFAEYYDSISNQWYLLPDPPVSNRILYFGAAVLGEDTIIIWNSFNFCLLDLSSLPPKWHFIHGPRLSGGTHDLVSNNTAVVKGIVYWSARDLLAFDLASNKRFAKPAFKFDESDSAIAPSVDFLRGTGTLPPILVATGEDQLSVIWFVEKQKEDKHLKVYLRKLQIQTSDDAEKGMLADCRKFQIQTSDDLEKEMPLHEDHDRSETVEFRIDGKQIYQCAAVRWHDDNKGKHNLNLDDVKPAIINPMDLLRNLACTMYKENFNSLSRIYRRRVVVEHTDTYIKLIDRPSQRQVYEADISIQDFLNSLGLQKYAKVFQENNIDMIGLKRISTQELKDMKIPMGPRSEILSALRSC